MLLSKEVQSIENPKVDSYRLIFKSDDRDVFTLKTSQVLPGRHPGSRYIKQTGSFIILGNPRNFKFLHIQKNNLFNYTNRPELIPVDLLTKYLDWYNLYNTEELFSRRFPLAQYIMHNCRIYPRLSTAFSLDSMEDAAKFLFGKKKFSAELVESMYFAEMTKLSFANIYRAYFNTEQLIKVISHPYQYVPFLTHPDPAGKAKQFLDSLDKWQPEEIVC